MRETAVTIGIWSLFLALALAPDGPRVDHHAPVPADTAVRAPVSPRTFQGSYSPRWSSPVRIIGR